MTNQETKYLNLIAKKLNDTISSQEAIELKQWMQADVENKSFAEEIIKTWELTGDYNNNWTINREQAWNKVNTSINAPIQTTTVVKSIFKTWQMVAAVVGVVSLTAFWLLNQDNTPVEIMVKINTTNDEQKEIQLPDSSMVVLNKNSTLAYEEAFLKRTVELNGEAFFEIAQQPNTSFQIISNNIQTTALGTSLNVKAYPQDSMVKISVLEGKVAVKDLNQNESELLLKAQEQVIINTKKHNSTLEKHTNTTISNDIAWKTQELIFDNNTMQEVIQTLEAYFDVAINAQNEAIFNCYYTGSFKQPTLQEVFDAIQFTTNITIKETPQNYTLLGEGCN